MLIFDAVVNEIHKSVLTEGICLRIFDTVFMCQHVIDPVFMRFQIAISTDDLLLGRLFLLPAKTHVKPLLRRLAPAHCEECVPLDLKNISAHKVDESIRNAVNSTAAPIFLGERIKVIKILVISVNKSNLAGKFLEIL